MRRTAVRRFLVLAVTFIAFAGGLLAPTTTSQAAPAHRDELVEHLRDERRGMVFDGLQRRAGGPCGDAFEIVEQASNGRVRCTHGPDPAPDGVDIRMRQEFPPASSNGTAGAATPQAAVAAAQAGIPCYGTGSDGYRVQLVYVRLVGSPDRSATLFPNFAAWAANANTTFKDSAAQTGGVRNIRFVTDGACNLVIAKAEVSSAAMGAFSTYVSDLKAQGFNRSDRKYLTWADANTYCGIGEIYTDDKATTTPGLSSSNANNGHPGVAGAFARTDNGCWGMANSVEAHELTHVLGGVQRTAPNATSGFHCRDESDRMCYDDGSGVTMIQRCPAANERLLDCNNDDYYSTNAPAGSYLATHWNVANSAFLAGSDPTPTTTMPTTTTTSIPPTTTTTSIPPTTTTTRPTTTTTTVAPTGTPSAPRNLVAARSYFPRGVRLTWTAPVTGPVTGYNVFRRTGTAAFVKVADLGTATSWTDTGAVAGTPSTYIVSAENGIHQGPFSNQATATAP
jgi:hypothetical protein